MSRLVSDEGVSLPMIKFNADEIFEMAEQIELIGAKFYRKAAQQSSDAKAEGILSKLAEMEDHHREIFAAMRRQLSGVETKPTTFDPNGEAALYLQAFVDGRVFSRDADPLGQADWPREHRAGSVDGDRPGEGLDSLLPGHQADGSGRAWQGPPGRHHSRGNGPHKDTQPGNAAIESSIVRNTRKRQGAAEAGAKMDRQELQMREVFQARQVTDSVYWVGAIDWGVRDFHGYLTSRGTTYNAYLILADKVTLIDTVKAPFKDEMIARIASVIEPEQIDFIVSNHAEPDHTGALVDAIEAISPEKVYASKAGTDALAAHYDLPCEITAVDDGQSISLGNMTLTAVETKMCHWPESMVSYLHEAKLLFSQDAFGMHLATYQLFNDNVDQDVLWHEAAKYHANILLPLSAAVEKSLAKLEQMALELDFIAPDHGPIWRTDQEEIIAAYAEWAAQDERTNEAVVVYDTMWSSTELMARAIGEGLARRRGRRPTAAALRRASQRCRDRCS